MRKFATRLALFACVLAMASVASAQDYRARVQGSVLDSSQGALPGATIQLVNEATAAKVFKVTDAQGRYLFDFVDPGTYTVTAELTGFKKAERKSIRVQQRGDVTANLTLEIGTLAETVTVQAEATQVQLNSSTAQVTLERQLIDQVPIAGRNPYSLAILDPTLNPGVGSTANENRPYHHAFASDYDAGGGTRRGNDVLLDGVALGLSYKTAYTPAMDAVEEVTISKTSVDAENGHSLGGIISLNMKSGTNIFRGSAYANFRDPSMNARFDPTIAVTPGQDTKALRGTELQMLGATFGGPIKKNTIFSFTSYEHWNDKRPISYVRTVPTAAERSGDFSQSVLNGKVRAIYNPFSSTLDSTGKVVRAAFTNNVIPTAMLDATALKMLQEMPLPNVAGNVDNLQYSVYDQTKYWNFSQRVDMNFTNNWKMFVRYGQFKANLYQQNPTDAGFFPLSGSNRYGMSVAADSVYVMSNKRTLNVRGSFNNLTDEFYNPSLLLGEDGLAGYWPNNPWYSSLYNSGYVYYPALDVTSGTGTATTNRLGRQGREWWQHPKSWTVAARMNSYEGRHSMKWGGDVRSYYGQAARFEPINLVFNSTLTANSSDSPDIVNSGNQWASFMLGTLDSQTSARLVPLQTVNLLGYSAYYQDDWRVNDRLTVNLGVRWEYEPGPIDPQNRLSVRYDLTSPIPEMQATPPVMPAQDLALMASKGYSYTYNGAWVFASDSNPHAWHATPWNFLPRVGVNYRMAGESVLRFAYARYMRATSDVRETLGDFVNQYTGFAQTTTTLGLSSGVPRQVLANPYPSTVNPVIEGYGQAYGRYTGLGSAISLDQYEQRPQINDRFNVSYQRRIWGGIVTDLSYFFNYGTRVPYDVNLNMMDPAFRYEQKTAINAQVTNPFRNYLTVDKFPGALRNTATVTVASLLVPYPQYTTITQTNTNGKLTRTHSFEARAQRPFTKGLSLLVSYGYSNEKTRQWFDDLANYKVLTSGGKDGWEWRPVSDVPSHRVTAAVSWQIPVGKDQKFGSTMPTALDYVIGGWQYTVSNRTYSGRPLLFGTSYLVSGNPKLSNPTRDKWFDTSMFAVADAYTPRTNPWYYNGLNGPGWSITDMTLSKQFRFGQKYRLEARIEAYNAFNQIIWDNPDLTISSATFGKVTRKRVDGSGREIQVGLRFIF